jgi:hypothetical protein
MSPRAPSQPYRYDAGVDALLRQFNIACGRPLAMAREVQLRQHVGPISGVVRRSVMLRKTAIVLTAVLQPVSSVLQ